MRKKESENDLIFQKERARALSQTLLPFVDFQYFIVSSRRVPNVEMQVLYSTMYIRTFSVDATLAQHCPSAFRLIENCVNILLFQIHARLILNVEKLIPNSAIICFESKTHKLKAGFFRVEKFFQR